MDLVHVRRICLKYNDGEKIYLVGDIARVACGVIAARITCAYVGDHAYDAVLALNTFMNGVRRLLGMRYWSLSSYLKIKVKNAVQFISER